MDFNATGDFDRNFREILLVHRYHFDRYLRHTAYQSGRKMSGFVYCISGSATYYFSDGEVTLLPRHLIYLPAHCAYRVETGEQVFHHITANFRLDREDLPGGTPAGRYPAIPTDSSRLPEDLMELAEIWRRKPVGYLLQAKAVLYRVLYFYVSALQQENHSGEYLSIRQGKEFMDERFFSGKSMAEIAAMCHLSETHFRRLFTRVVGMPPHTYLRERRMAQAKELLRAEEFSVAEVARAVGFEDSNYFSRVFRESVGMTPSEFARKKEEIPRKP